MFTGKLSELLEQKKKPYNHSKGIPEATQPIILKTVKGSANIKFGKPKMMVTKVTPWSG